MRKNLLTISAIALAASAWAQNSRQLGNSSNAFTILRPQQNQVIANSDLNTIVFIHRVDTSVTAQNGRLQYDISTDGGDTWTNNIGNLNDTYTRRGRYPNVSLYNPSGNTNPTQSYLVWAAPTLSTAAVGWDGHVNGTSPLTLSNPNSTENYQFFNTNTGIPGGLCQGAAGVYWLTEAALTQGDTLASDTINVYKGVWNGGTQNVDWSKVAAKYINFSTSFDGVRHFTGPNVAFSPDGQTGYIGLLGDIGAADSIYNIIYCKSTDGGNTWGNWSELILNNVPGLLDSAQIVAFDDGNGGIIAASEVCSGFDMDMTVDANGNAHFFTVVCVGEARDVNTNAVGTQSKQYSVWSGFPKAAWDIYTTNGGTSWVGNFVSSVHTFRSTLASISIDNYTQISRSEDGTHVFYSWADSDTLVIGSTANNDNPNLRVAGMRVADGFKTCYRRIEGITGEDFVFAPTMSPTVLDDGANTYVLPIAYMQVLTDNDNPVAFHHPVTAKFCEVEFQAPATVDLSWDFNGACYSAPICFLSVEEPTAVQFALYPNPTQSDLNVTINSDEEIRSAVITNMLGQVVQTLNASAIQTNGEVNTLNVSNLADGMYNLSMVTSTRTISKKFTVSK